MVDVGCVGRVGWPLLVERHGAARHVQGPVGLDMEVHASGIDWAESSWWISVLGAYMYKLAAERMNHH